MGDAQQIVQEVARELLEVGYELQSLLLKRPAPASASKGGFFGFGGGSGKAAEPDYTARGRKGPTGAAY